jgi:hypothetical protein
MQKSITSFGHFSLRKWPMMIGVLMLLSFLASPTWAGQSCNQWCEQKGTWWCNLAEGVKNRLCGLFGPVSRSKHGSHMGPIRIPLMEPKNKTILLPGKKLVVFNWEGGEAPYRVKVEGNGRHWENPKPINEINVGITEEEFRFEAGRYWLTVSYSVKDTRTGKDIRTSIKRKLTVKKTGCESDYSSQLIDFDSIPSECQFEAFQQPLQ